MPELSTSPGRQALKSPPPLPGGMPLLGHTVSFVRDLTGLLQRARDQCGDVARIDVLGKSIVLVTGTAGQEQVFRSADDVLSPKAAYKMMIPVFGKGVAYDCEDDRMNEQLQMLMPALRNKRMRTYAEIVGAETTDAIAEWGESAEFDLYEWLQTLTSFTSSHCLLGHEFRNEMSEEFASVYHDLERGVIPLAYLHAHLPIPTFRRRDKARARLGEMVGEIVAARRARDERHEDFLQTLMESTYKDGSTLSDHEITGILVAAMFAGHHTSAATTTWAIFEMMQNPEWMKKAVDEVDSVYGDGREIDFASLRELPHLEWIIKESLRLHPPLFVLLRVALQDTEILGHAIPKGTWVAVSPSVAHRIEETFPEADNFCPHRFGGEKPADGTPFAFIAFGGGRHKCLGNAFAILQIKAILAKLLREYDFEKALDPIESDFRGLVIAPKAPCRVRVRKRQVQAPAQDRSSGT